MKNTKQNLIDDTAKSSGAANVRRVTALMSRPPISQHSPEKTWSCSDYTVRHYDLELNVDLNCGDFAEFLDNIMNTDEFKNKVKLNA